MDRFSEKKVLHKLASCLISFKMQGSSRIYQQFKKGSMDRFSEKKCTAAIDSTKTTELKRDRWIDSPKKKKLFVGNGFLNPKVTQ